MIHIHVLDPSYVKDIYSSVPHKKPTGILANLALNHDMSTAIIDCIPEEIIEPKDVSDVLELIGDFENVFFADLTNIDNGRIYCSFKKENSN